MNNRLKLQGIIPPLITPLTHNRQLDKAALDRIIEHIIAGGCHGIFAIGTTGEGPSLPYKMRIAIVQQVCKRVNGRLPVLVGITDTIYEGSLNIAQLAHDAGASALVAAPPYYFNMSQEALVAYFLQLAEDIKLPMTLYNMPGCTKVAIETATVQRCSEHPNIIGLKDSSADLGYFQEVRNLMKHQPDFSLLVGPEILLASVISLGADGGVTGGANVFPKLFVSLYEAAKAGNDEIVQSCQKQVENIGKHLYQHAPSAPHVIRGLKAAMAAQGLCEPYMMTPFENYPQLEKAAVQKVIKKPISPE